MRRFAHLKARSMAIACAVGGESLTLVVGRGHAWFGQTPLKPHHLLETPWLLREPGSGTGTALGALPASMVAQEITSKLLWPVTLAGYTLRAEAIWMVRSPHRRDSQLMSRFEALIETTQP